MPVYQQDPNPSTGYDQDGRNIDQTPYNPHGAGGPGPIPPAGPAAPTAAADGGGGGGGVAGGAGFMLPDGMFASPQYNFTNAPEFNAPEFNAPTGDAAWNDPGYKFRLESGRNALERSAAARGTLRTGGTLRDIMDYGQNFAAQEYGNIYNRALQQFNTQYQGAKDEYAPGFADWQMRQNAELSRGNQEFGRQWDLYALDKNLGLSRDQLLGNMLTTPPQSPA